MLKAPLLPLILLSATATALGADAAVIQVGAERLDAAAVARALGRVPAFQLQELGADDAARRRAVVERRLVPELLGYAEAKARGLDHKPRTADRMRELYSKLIDGALERDAAEQQPVTEADIQRYFDEHRARFETPHRMRIWRILVNDEELAKKIIAESRGPAGPARWRNFAREHSLDTATKLRDGDLGFVRADGSTETPRVRVDPAVYSALERLPEGEIAPNPIKVGSALAVVWRRGSLPAISRTVQQEAPAIRALLTRERLEAHRKQLLARLRKEHVELKDAQLLETLPDAMFAPPPSALKVSPPLPSAGRAKAGAETPKPGDRGTR